MPYLYVKTSGLDGMIAVPYKPEMPMYKYLKEYLAKECRSRFIHDGCTVAERFSYKSPAIELAQSTQVVFSRENRLTELGLLIPPEATLDRILDCGDKKTLHGNATRGDLTDECVFCCGTVEGHTNFELDGCAHRFHAKCMAQYIQVGSQSRCAVCRQAFSSQDMTTMLLVEQLLSTCAPVASG